MISTDKLKQARDAIEVYLDKYDPSSVLDEKERVAQRDLLTAMISKNNEAISKIGENINNNLLEKVIGSFITKQIEPTLVELKSAITALKFPQITEKELGVPKLLTQVAAVEKAIKNIPGNEVELAEVGIALKGLQKGIDALVKKDITVPAFPSALSIQTLPSVEKKLDTLVETIKSIPQNMPKVMPVDNGELIKLLTEVKEAISQIKVPEFEFPDAIEVSNFPIQKIAQPVTHVSLNSLRGFVKTTATTVSSTLTTLPFYGVLDNRRAVLVYNNSANTIFVGGSDVTTANGMPVPASSYSPILDAGKELIVYGIAVSGSNNIRVMEISDEASGR